jgi:hypothetical protein
MYYISAKNVHLMAVSFVVYLFVNLFENLIHYNIGRLSKNGVKHSEIIFPSKDDLFRIVIVMLIFAGLQGLLTYWFNT